MKDESLPPIEKTIDYTAIRADRPGGITLLALLHTIGGILSLLILVPLAKALEKAESGIQETPGTPES